MTIQIILHHYKVALVAKGVRDYIWNQVIMIKIKENADIAMKL
jgi:hypothetical protein